MPCVHISIFELPLYCCLVVFVLGVVLHLGWRVVTRAAEEEARESEVLEVVGRQVEEAVDLIVQAAVFAAKRVGGQGGGGSLWSTIKGMVKAFLIL